LYALQFESDKVKISQKTKALTAIASGIIAILVFTLVANREPTYQEKSVKQWSKILWVGSPSERTNAASALRTIGTNAIPVLEEMLRSKDSKIRTAFLDICSKQSVVRYPYMDRSIDYNRIAMKATGALGDQARPMVPLLQEIILDWRNQSGDVVQDAMRIARKFEPDTTPELGVLDGKAGLIFPTMGNE